jgi:hypothetical protein
MNTQRVSTTLITSANLQKLVTSCELGTFEVFFTWDCRQWIFVSSDSPRQKFVSSTCLSTQSTWVLPSSAFFVLWPNVGLFFYFEVGWGWRVAFACSPFATPYSTLTSMTRPLRYLTWTLTLMRLWLCLTVLRDTPTTQYAVLNYLIMTLNALVSTSPCLHLWRMGLVWTSVAATQVGWIQLNVLSVGGSSQLRGIRGSANGVTIGPSCSHSIWQNNNWLQRNMGINVIRLNLPSRAFGSSKSRITRWQSDFTRNG